MRITELHMRLAGQDVVFGARWLYVFETIHHVFPDARSTKVRIRDGDWLLLGWQDSDGAARAREIRAALTDAPSSPLPPPGKPAAPPPEPMAQRKLI